ncbi:MATE family efflux transporter [uncultured Endozoicomonas sp.]|uniref:MATE family efflux transporter n=1 Tax=uncultured Endozoicomonas sp. TaxID=432652 RepID=UPI002629DCEB|nr:MATE family efflux transporter [uncultured Endozoicomonas sp.]
MLVFFLFQGGQFILAGFVRNDTNPGLAMKAIMSGFMLNIILDYIFIFPLGWGIKGAALATGLSQLLIFVLLLTHFIQGKGKLRLTFSGGYSVKTGMEIIRIGSPNFFIESTAAVTAVFFNYILLTRFSALHVTAYSIIMNVGLVVMLVFSGTGQACQPIISYNFGGGKIEKVRETLYLGLRYAVVVGVVAIAISLAGAEYIVSMFTDNNPQLVELASIALKIYLAGSVFMGVNIVVATFFQSVESPAIATVISLSRGLVFVLIGLLILPMLFPANGVWGSIFLAEVVTLGVSLLGIIQFLNKTYPRFMEAA